MAYATGPENASMGSDSAEWLTLPGPSAQPAIESDPIDTIDLEQSSLTPLSFANESDPIDLATLIAIESDPIDLGPH